MKRKVRLNSIITGLLFTTIVTINIFFSPTSIGAAKNESSMVKSTLDKAIGEAAKNYKTEFDLSSPENPIEFNEQTFKSYYISTDNVIFEHQGLSAFIDLIGVTFDDKYINISEYANWSSDNQEVAFADLGRIIADGKGNATVTVSYGDYNHKIKVNVKKYVDLQKMIDDINNEKISSFSLTPTEREEIRSRGMGMLNYLWIPNNNVRGWRNNYTFTSGNVYIGIPYSQTDYQCNLDDFKYNFNNPNTTGFYTNYTRTFTYSDGTSETIIMPKYGNDCSGFVSISWGISRQTTKSFLAGIKSGTYPKVGSYTYTDSSYPTASVLETAYTSLDKGDAVVKNGHTFLIAANDIPNSRVIAYEQTPYITRVQAWSYSDMASDGYLPFAKK